MAEKGEKRAILACKLSDQYDKLISTILIGNNIVNILAASVGTMLFVSLYGDAGATISTIVLTILVLIFGEVSPKSIAKDCPEKFAMFSTPFIQRADGGVYAAELSVFAVEKAAGACDFIWRRAAKCRRTSC